jgi:hypothetical protein
MTIESPGPSGLAAPDLGVRAEGLTAEVSAKSRFSPIAAMFAIAGVGLLAALVLTSSVSAAASHSVKATLKETAISFTPGPAPDGPPSFALEAGVLTGSLGRGANRTEVHVLAGKGTRELYTRQGSLRGSFVFTGQRKAGGSTIVGTLTITGGTGKYSGAHGKLHIDGFHSDKTNVSTEHLSGNLTY